MPSFNRQWTLLVGTDIVRFRTAFEKLIISDKGKWIILNKGLSNTIGKDYFGTLTKNSFYIYKRKGILDLAQTGLTIQGKIKPHQDGLTLDIELPNRLLPSFISVGIVLAFVLYVGLNALFLSFGVRLNGGSIYIAIIEILAIFALMIYLEIKATHRNSDRLMRQFTKVLRTIEAEAINPFNP